MIDMTLFQKRVQAKGSPVVQLPDYIAYIIHLVGWPLYSTSAVCLPRVYYIGYRLPYQTIYIT